MTYPGAESYRPYLQADTSAAENVVVVTLFEFGEARVETTSLDVGHGLVELSCLVAGTVYRVRLGLAGSGGESPRLTVFENGRVLLDRADLAVPTETPG